MFRALQAHRLDFSTDSRAASAVHLAVAKATLVIPASVQMFSTSTMFL
jgi:hypothetical protein